ncbi:MAG: inorganic diphosphatase [Paracoccaceae bacterium]
MTELSEALSRLAPVDENGNVTVFIETPSGSRHKYDLDETTGLLRWSLELPEGNHFPCAFGFVPNTLGGDGDELDIALLIDGEIPSRTLVASRLVGVLRLEQDEDGEMARNDRIVAVAHLSRAHGNIRTLDDLGPDTIWDLSEFFSTYNRMIGRAHNLLGTGDAAEAHRMLDEAIARARA